LPILKTRVNEVLWARLWHQAYEVHADIVSLPSHLQQIEREIVVAVDSQEHVVKTILDAVCRVLAASEGGT
jgi:hypothetical protein